MQKQLPEAVRATSSTCLVFSDFQKLTIQQLEEVCKWLMSRVVMFSGNIAECIKSDTHLFQLTADGTALTLHQNWLQSLKVTCGIYCDQFPAELRCLLDTNIACARTHTCTHTHTHTHTHSLHAWSEHCSSQRSCDGASKPFLGASRGFCIVPHDECLHCRIATMKEMSTPGGWSRVQTQRG